MPDYSKGKIYKIVCNVTGKVYYGSTVEPTVAKRLSKHVASFKCFKQGIGRNVTSYEILEGNNYNIILVEEYPCQTKDQILMRERWWIDNHECVNKFSPIVSKEEAIQRHNECSKLYNQEHRGQYKEYQKKYQKKYRQQQKLSNLEIIEN